MTLTFNDVAKTRLLVLQTEAVKPATIIIQVHRPSAGLETPTTRKSTLQAVKLYLLLLLILNHCA